MSNRVILGNYGGSFVARISKPGNDVLSAPLMSSYYLHELYRGHRILQSGTTYFPANATTCSISYPNFGFVPIIFASPGLDTLTSYPFISGGNIVGVFRITQTPTATSCVFTRNVATSTIFYMRYIILPLVN